KKHGGGPSTGDASPNAPGSVEGPKVKEDKKKVADVTENVPPAPKGPAEGKEGDPKESKSSPSSAPPAPASGENSVYRVALDGTVREVFREKALILSMVRRGDRFLVGTGMDGQLFEADETSREKTELARLDH